jgi:phenylacetate-coenzyme A ligase PaaK-like adenylate-forming protein
MRDWLRARGLAAYQRLTGRRPWDELGRLRELQWRPAAELEARALGKLRAIVSHAHAHVPYYRDLLRRTAVDPGDVGSLADLSRVPISRKADLRPQPTARVLADNLPARRRAPGSTAGSTGMPFRFFTDRATADVWLGSYMLFREWANAPFGGTMLWIPGPAHGSAATTSIAWMRAAATSLALGERTIRLSDFEPDRAELCRRIRRSVGDDGFAIWGFPSYIARIAKELLESGAELPSYPRIVFTYAETLSLLNQRAIELAFRCRTANHYSAWEVLHMAQTCPDNPELLHVNSERAILRVVRQDGSLAPPGEVGRLVVTDLANYVMPLINYEIGDWAVAGERCPCGRGFPTLASLEGRLGEVLRTPTGRAVLPIALCRFLNISARAHPYIWEYQAVQTAPERVAFKVVPTTRLTPDRVDWLRAQLEGFLGPGMSVTVDQVDRIPVEASGKRLLVRSHIASS